MIPLIGSGLRKMAAENGMHVASGVAYGNLGGFAATLSEGAGTKQIAFAVEFPDPAQRSALMDLVAQTELKKTYRVQNIGISPKNIQVIFMDNPGTMGKIQEFLQWFLPVLHSYGATGANVCTRCGQEMDDCRWAMINGVAYPFHEGCARAVKQEIDAGNTRQQQEDTGSYGLGLLGAVLGAALGAIVWAIVLNMGFVASVVGLLIGWLASKGYDLLHGRQGKGKVWILGFAVVLGVLLGTFGADVFDLAGEILGGGLPGLSVLDIPNLIGFLLANDAEYRATVLGNGAMGMLFAALGVYGILRQARKDVSGDKYQELN